MPKRNKMSRRRSSIITGLTVSMYIAYVILLFWHHPFVVSAEEDTAKEETIPGGSGNIVSVYSEYSANNQKYVNAFTIKVKEGYELLASITAMGSLDNVQYYQLDFITLNLSNNTLSNLNESHLVDYTGYTAVYKNGELQSSNPRDYPSTGSTVNLGIVFYGAGANELTGQCDVTGCKIFQNSDALRAYVQTGNLDGMIKEPVLDTSWYIKNVSMIVTADDSPSSEAGEDATYVTFTWDIDNLQEGDLIEIKTHNYYKSLNGEEHGGFYDYITQANNVSAYVGKYGPFSQYEATKAWYKSLDYHPLFFKSYDTDAYYIRPIRNGKVGGWVKIPIERNPLIKGSPYMGVIEYGDLDKEGNWTINKELTEKEGGYGTDQNGTKYYPSSDDSNNIFEGTNISGIFKSFFDFFKDIPSMLGGLPGLVNSTIGFLPNWVIGFIAIGIVVVIILRIVGR